MDSQTLYSVKDVVELTNEKTGNVELYRKKLRESGLLENNANLDPKQVEVFKSICAYKERVKTTWEYAMDKFIYDSFMKYKIAPIKVHEDIIIEHLIWSIKNDSLNVIHPNSSAGSNEFHEVYEIIIDNFAKVGEYDSRFEGSFGTDGNPVTTFKCTDEKLECFYYIVGKYGRKSKEEEIHVFYNDGLNFNIMKLQYINGGILDKGTQFHELLQICREKVHSNILSDEDVADEEEEFISENPDFKNGV